MIQSWFPNSYHSNRLIISSAANPEFFYLQGFHETSLTSEIQQICLHDQGCGGSWILCSFLHYSLCSLLIQATLFIILIIYLLFTIQRWLVLNKHPFITIITILYYIVWTHYVTWIMVDTRFDRTCKSCTTTDKNISFAKIFDNAVYQML